MIRDGARRLARWTAGLCLLGLLGCGREPEAVRGPEALSPPPPAPKAARLGAASLPTGSVLVRHAKEPYWEPVSDGAELRSGDWLRTGADATVHLTLSNGAALDVDPDSLVVLELSALGADLGRPSVPSVAVSQGSVRAVAQRGDATAEAPELYLGSGEQTQRVSLAQGAGRGEYRIRALDEGTQIASPTGGVVVQLGTQYVELSPSKATLVTDSLSEPAELPDFPESLAPGVDARSRFPPDRPLFLKWKPVPGVKGYRVQIARDLGFTQEARTAEVTGTIFEVKPPAAGLYVWRIAARSPQGLLGEFGFARRLYFEETAPAELLLSPENGEVIGYQTKPPDVVFQWQAAAGASGYLLSVSRTGDPLEKPVVSLATDAQRLEVHLLGPGDYTWGVYQRPGLRPIFMSPRRLAVKQMSATPVVKAPSSIQFE